MAREQAKRTALIGQLADHVLAQGLGGASLRPLAAAVGTSDRMLLYYFSDKAALIGAVLDEIAARMTALLDEAAPPAPLPRPALQAALMPLLRDPAVWPFMQVWLEMASLAARGDPDCARVGERIARGFVAWGVRQLDVAEGEREAEAVRLLLTIEGAVLLTSLGLGEEVGVAITGT